MVEERIVSCNDYSTPLASSCHQAREPPLRKDCVTPLQMLNYLLPEEDDAAADSFQSRGRRSNPSSDIAASILETSRPIQQSLVGVCHISLHPIPFFATLGISLMQCQSFRLPLLVLSFGRWRILLV